MNNTLKIVLHFLGFIVIGLLCAIINKDDNAFVCGVVGALMIDYLIYKYKEK